ncbi:MAG: phosphoribulokinase [Pseudomonadota bacterium]|nr:phosphoribulokinase [Pseudomonadota bacterium]
MSVKHPIIAITGSSGAGTTTVKKAFEDIFRRLRVKPAIIEGDSFHRYDRKGMKEAVIAAEKEGRDISHFGPEANLFDKLEELFRQYSRSGTGQVRKYLHNEEEAAPYNQEPGTFTDWEMIEEGTDVLFYEGLHGGVVNEEVNVEQFVDLLVGVVPSVNLEWIQKINRDVAERGYSPEAVTHTILRRMPDYVKFILPQFTHSHINFQRVALVDTSNPFIARDIPSADESLVVIRFNKYRDQDYTYLLSMIHDSFMSRPNTLVVPGGKMGFAIQIIFRPIVAAMIEKRRQALV